MSLSRRSFTLAGAAAAVLPAQSLLAAPARADGTVTVSVPEIDLAGPRVATVPITVRNGGARQLRDLSVTFTGPVGWVVEPELVRLKGSLAAGATATASFELLVPEPRPGLRLITFTATASYAGGDGAGQATGSRTVRLGDPLPDLAAAYNNVGVTDESNPAPGNYDGDGNSFSAQKLADVGIVPGGPVLALGARLIWPDVAPGSRNNVACGSQAIALSGSGSRLVFLGSGVGNSAVGTAEVFYTDGSSSRGTFGFPNWSFQNVTDFGATQIAAANGRNLPGGYGNEGIAYSVFAHSVPLTAGKTAEVVVLPGNGGIHVFALAIAP
ncbi:hypothetical protein SRB5_21090 [Streptomyces sp. RB5]|uniref:Alpha-galactosidase NEW3 domain-containing protein n=1 Tax=Streptomyces smaragdinus TaxID=2585196 RepID=A0A7K0CET5_9ACTN|nr:NEW3 domain-containing protein [Streptomyces smaragdinus]MQY11981.1 hypothetical protein [Streptomyces smaragdinus]